MRNKKLIGSFYTPKIISNFLLDYIAKKLTKKSVIKVLEPSVGDGVFIHSLIANSILSSKITRIIAVEKQKKELDKIKIDNKYYSGIHADFLEFQKNNKDKFSICIGNPPYIKKNYLTKNQIRLSEEIHSNAKLSNFKIKNIWTAFLIRSIQFLESDGILAFVLPAELLQVKFAAELREYIVKQFERVEIFTFNELLFKEVKATGQDTVLLIGEKKSTSPGVYYCNIDKAIDLKEKKINLVQNISIKDSKWTHHHLNIDEIELLEKLKKQLNVINNYCSSRAGIVTAANDFFIVNTDTVNKYSLKKYVKKIVQRGVFVNGSVVISKDDFKELINSSKPTYLITLNKNSTLRKNSKIWTYLDIGKEKKIDKRYKTSIRNKWYEVPNIGTPPEAFYFKRCSEYPKLIKNDAKVLATDSAYTITMKDSFKIENMIFSFYNSLTLAFAELHGRYYGGGVLELTPNEFKNLPVPYLENKNIGFTSFVKAFKSKDSIKDICSKNDMTILKSIDKDIDDDTINKISEIREKLFFRRIKAI